MTQLDTYPTADHETSTEPLTFEEMYAAYSQPLLRQAIRFNARDPEAAVQDVFIRAYNSFESYKDMGKTHMAWLQTILRNLIIDEKRRDARGRQLPASDSYAFEILPDHETEEAIQDLELDIAVVHRMTELVNDKRVRMLRLYAGGSSYEEISAELGVTVGTVKSNINRARTALMADPEIRDLLNKAA